MFYIQFTSYEQAPVLKKKKGYFFRAPTMAAHGRFYCTGLAPQGLKY